MERTSSRSFNLINIKIRWWNQYSQRKHNQGVYVIGATNTPWYLDPALRRPGRFNQLIFIPPPSEEEREIILKLKTNNKPQAALHFKKVAGKTQHFSGADLEQLINDAIESALERSMETGELQPLSN